MSSLLKKSWQPFSYRLKTKVKKNSFSVPILTSIKLVRSLSLQNLNGHFSSIEAFLLIPSKMFSVLSFWLFIFSLVSPQTVTAQNGVVVQTEVWCVAKNNAEDAALQGAIDWACGEGGADCGPIQKGGPCYDPTDIQTTASFAFNDYYLKHGLTDDACYFQNTAALTSLNPSKYLP